MKNIEIKARCPDFAPVRRALAAIGAAESARIEQRDTFFRVPRGRLKLREAGAPQVELIYYERPDDPGPRTSSFEVVRIDAAEPARAFLGRALGVDVEVVKTRELWLLEGTRVHLDEVDGLGSFLEIEVPVREEEEARRTIRRLMRALLIAEEDLIAPAYRDLIAERRASGDPRSSA